MNCAPAAMHVQEGARADDNPGNVLHDILDDIDRAGDRHGNFDQRDTAVGNFFDREARIFRGRSANYRYQPHFFDA